MDPVCLLNTKIYLSISETITNTYNHLIRVECLYLPFIQKRHERRKIPISIIVLTNLINRFTEDGN